MISKANSPQNHQFTKYKVMIENDNEETSFDEKKSFSIFNMFKKSEDKVSITLPLDKIDKIFHPILTSSLCIDPTKRERFDEILEHLVDSYIQVANIP